MADVSGGRIYCRVRRTPCNAGRIALTMAPSSKPLSGPFRHCLEVRPLRLYFVFEY
jgi:hypothetical protein